MWLMLLLPMFQWPELNQKALPASIWRLLGCHFAAALPAVEGKQDSSESPAFLSHKKKAGVAPNPACVSASRVEL